MKCKKQIVYAIMKKCIFCGRTEAEFEKENCWTEEHIIPEALGNERLKIYNVCKDCNSGLGTYVDNYFVNNMLVKIIRQTLGIRGQSGKVPNAFKEGTDKAGHRIQVNDKFQPKIVPYIEQNENKLRIVAPTKKEAKEMAVKKLSRMKSSEKTIQDVLDRIDQTPSHFSQPEIQYDIEIDFNQFFLEALKIAFEYAVYKLGDNYLKDLRAIEIQKHLKCAIKGELKKKSVEFYGVCIAPEKISRSLERVKGLNCHLLMIHPNAENKLISEVFLFMEPILSFSVLISDDASQYCSSMQEFTDIVQIKSISNLSK